MMRRRGAGGQDPGASVSQSSGIVPSKVAATLKKFDVYPKLETDYEVKSSAGATGVSAAPSTVTPTHLATALCISMVKLPTHH